MRVLLAADGSNDSRRATRWLQHFAPTVDIEPTVLTVATLTEPPRDSRTMSQLRESVVTQARHAAEKAAKVLRPRWPEVKTLVTEGDPRVEIVRAAEDLRADMLALGARGVGRLKRLLVGSTSLAAARYAPCPVAIVRGRARPVRRALVAVDGSEGSRAALRFLSLFDLVREARVGLLHVLQGPAQTGDERRTPQADVEKMLTDAATVLGAGRYPIERLVVDGDPGRQIVSIASSRNVDLVVLGARGLRTLGRLLLGSVSETVLHHAGRPVVIVRER
jgi:nucleotide-binding universal stress UspA family protein